MELSFEELKQLIIENGEKAIVGAVNKAIVYKLPLEEFGIICGTVDINDDYEAAFLEHKEFFSGCYGAISCIRYNETRNKIQRMTFEGYNGKFDAIIKWHDINGNTFKQQGDDFYFFKSQADIKEFTRKYISENKNKLSKELNRMLKNLNVEIKEHKFQIRYHEEKLKALNRKKENALNKLNEI